MPDLQWPTGGILQLLNPPDQERLYDRRPLLLRIPQVLQGFSRHVLQHIRILQAQVCLLLTHYETVTVLVRKVCTQYWGLHSRTLPSWSRNRQIRAVKSSLGSTCNHDISFTVLDYPHCGANGMVG